jgi:multiple sugar transport system permease protein
MKKTLYYLMLIFLMIIFFFPVVWIFLTSLKTTGEIYAWPPTFLPQNPILDNYRTVFLKSNLGLYIGNTLLVALGSTLSVILLASLAGYGIARVKFKGSTLFLVFFLAMSMFPQLTIAPSLFIWLRQIKLINTYAGLIIVYTGLFTPIAVWILSTYFKTIPMDIEESAKIDGCSSMRILFQILIPLALPGMAAAALIVAIFVWNEFLLSLIILSKDTMRTATVGIALYPGEYAFPWELITTATFLAVLPLVFVLFFFQKSIIGGLTAGAVKS